MRSLWVEFPSFKNTQIICLGAHITYVPEKALYMGLRNQRQDGLFLVNSILFFFPFSPIFTETLLRNKEDLCICSKPHTAEGLCTPGLLL